MAAIDLKKNDYIKTFMDERPVDRRRAALCVIDMQYATGVRDGALGRYLAERQQSHVARYRFDRIETLVVPNSRRLLQAFRGFGSTVLYTRNGSARPDASDAPPHMRKLFRDLEVYEGSPAYEIVPELAPLPGELVLRKVTIGAFASTGMDSALRNLGVDQLYMVGVSTNMCVEGTAREAADRGYAVTLVEDACGTTQPALHEACMTNFQRLYGRVKSTDEVLAELVAR
jgi:biuret amidohydrolase